MFFPIKKRYIQENYNCENGFHDFQRHFTAVVE